MTELKEILPGFEYFKFEATGEKHRLLKVYFNGDEKNAPVGYWFEHQSNRPSRIKSITVDKKDGIPISELVARGWVAEKAK
jgi:predicted AAA+ superfamily ATPase